MIRWSLVTIPLLLSLAVQAFPQTEALSALEVKLDRVAQKLIENQQAVGISLAIVQEDKLVLSRQYGVASLETKKPITVTTEFPIGSVSKQFTAACLLLLAEDGKLGLDDPVAKYFPDLTRANEITIRDLLNHVSGYRDWYPLDFVDPRLTKKIRPEQVREIYGKMQLDFEPATHYSYTNTGYLIAGLVVEKVSGEPFYRFLKRRILTPLGISHTHEYRLKGGDLVSRYSSFFGSPPTPSTLENPGWLLGAGGLTSTAEDLAKWDIALMSGKILSADSWKEMTSPRALKSGALSQYGFGQFMTLARGHRVVGHDGGVSGGITTNLMFPDDRAAIVIISNFDMMPFGPLRSTLLDAILTPNLAPQPSPPPAKDAAPRSPVIKPVGPTAVDVAKALYLQILEDRVDRTKLTPECSDYLSERQIKANHARLVALGPPTEVRALGTDERGQMEVTELLFQFKTVAYRMLMYRRLDGTVAEFMVAA